MKQGDIYYTGVIIEVTDKTLYEIIVDIPGIIQNVKAYPMRGEIDEPRVGDHVLLKSLDPIFQSYYLYQKLKENDFIGIRSNGKMVDITPDYIQIGIFDIDAEFNDNGEEYRPKLKDWIKLDKEGNLDINLRKNSTINIMGDQENNYNNNLSIKIQGDANLTVLGTTTVQSTKIEIKGPGTLKCQGTVIPSETGGPFIAVPTAPPPGTPMISGDTIILT